MSNPIATPEGEQPSLPTPEIVREPIKAGEVKSAVTTIRRLLKRKEGDMDSGRYTIDTADGPVTYDSAYYGLAAHKRIKLEAPTEPQPGADVKAEIVTAKSDYDTVTTSVNSYTIDESSLLLLDNNVEVGDGIVTREAFGATWDDESVLQEETIDLTKPTTVDPDEFRKLAGILESLTGDSLL